MQVDWYLIHIVQNQFVPISGDLLTITWMVSPRVIG